MTKTHTLQTILTFCLTAFLSITATAQVTPSSPNIIYIMLDDAGFADFDNPDIISPNFDRMAAQGTRFNRFYVTPTCAPTRVGVMAGVNPLILGYNHPSATSGIRGIPQSVVTLPEALNDFGYNTAHIGKWHSGILRESNLPSQQGFDYTVLYDLDQGAANTDFWDPVITFNDDPMTSQLVTGHKTEILTDYVLDYLDDQQSSTAPFFLNLWYNAPHGPVQPTQFWRDQYPSNQQGVHHAMMSLIDEQVGRILDKLDELGIAEDTIVMLTSDNGAISEKAISNSPLRGAKQQVFDGGIRVPLYVLWPGTAEAGRDDRSILSVADLMPTLLDIAGTSVSKPFGGQSFLPIIEGLERNVIRSDDLQFAAKTDTGEDTAIISGFYKMVKTFNGTELFNIIADPEESNDLSLIRPSKVVQLTRFFTDWKTMATQIDFTVFARRGIAYNARIDRLNFVRMDASASIEDSEQFDFDEADFTAAFILKLDASAPNGAIKHLVRMPDGWEIKLNANDQVVVALKNPSGNPVLLRSQSSLQPGIRYLVAFTVYNQPGSDPADTKLYVHDISDINNLTLDDETQAFNRLNHNPDLEGLRLGHPTLGNFIGTLDDLHFFTLRLTEDELIEWVKAVR